MNAFWPLISQPPSTFSARGLDRGGVRAGAGLGEPERAERASLGEGPEPTLLLLVGAHEEQRQAPDGDVGLPGRRDRLVGVAELLHRGHEGDGRHAGTAPLLGHEQAEQAEVAHPAEHLGGAALLLPVPRRVRPDLLGREVARELLQRGFVLGEREVHSVLRSGLIDVRFSTVHRRLRNASQILYRPVSL